ncbi:MAG: cobyric acid synthase [Devosiaceae bacterium]|nr:cobyric acid synthase [Devosiaceae bacterium]
MSARALMFMGTGSDVGKSLIVAGLCRAFTNRGLKVMPFKPQNMSNNAAVTKDNGEIGRAQALQARAARTTPLTSMNPVLLKPEHERGAQVIVRGKRVATMSASRYFSEREKYLPQVMQAFSEVCDQADLVLIEGAGSASEINLRHNDIANFGFARAADIPVMIIGDIQRGGVIASLVGTFNVIDPLDAALVAGTLVNRFQGDPDLFKQGLEQIEQRTNRPCFGPVSHFEQANLLPAEDILGLHTSMPPNESQKILIAVPQLPRIANFDDLDPLKMMPEVELIIVPPDQPLPLNAHLIILPGSKSTRSDLAFLKAQGWDIDLAAHARRGGRILGICAGFQMLGQSISDPDGIEGNPGTSTGLGLLQVDTKMTLAKQLRLENARDAQFNCPLSGYHMHMGRTWGTDCDRPFSICNGTSEGAVSPAGNVMGTYLHGLFGSDEFRGNFVGKLGAQKISFLNYEARIEQVLDNLAQHLEQHLDLDALHKIAKPAKIGAQTP